MLYPSTNAWDVPDLLLRLQPVGVTASVCQWGSICRKTRMTGTWVFYVEDYKFAGALRDHGQVPRTGCAAAVEPNITLFDESPAAEVVAAVYRKRAAARAWQAAGVRVFADVNVPARYLELNALGLPAGWAAFATRGYAGRLDALRREHEWSRAWAGEALVMLVYGGGRPVQEVCRELGGSVWVPSGTDELRGLR